MQPGTQLGHYEILSPLGKGGMGEVWRAKDTKLGREVAIKTLPEEFAKDEERLARFEREAKLLASLNHPNIATIHGLEEDDGTRFIVLELVGGETLAELLVAGSPPVESALNIALQVAEGLEVAHEKGVIHRDLKPANIKVTPDGQVKVLDFGLAKTVARDRSDAGLSNSPTLSVAETEQGVILGTAAYMSPEQARGESADRRADIWAFGCVLFEMLTGRGTFDGRTVSDVLAGVLAREPHWDSLPANLHPRLRLLLERCLEKEARDRGHDIADVRVDIQKVLAGPGGVLVQPVADVAGKTRFTLPWSLAGIALGSLVAGVTVWNLRSPPALEVTRMTVNLPTNLRLSGGFPLEQAPLGRERPSRLAFAFAPDGRHLVFVGIVGGETQLYLRPMEQGQATAMPGTIGASSPFFSPNGESIGFFLGDQLKRISVGGGETRTIGTAPGSDFDNFGASWTGEDTILLAGGDGLFQISANGGTAERLTTVDADQEASHSLPELLPGGEAVLFSITRAGGSRSHADIVVHLLETGERRVLAEDGGVARYATSGHLVFSRSGALLAAPFDVGRLEMTGERVVVIEGVMDAEGAITGDLQTGIAQFSFSNSGSLAYVSGGIHAPIEHPLIWVDRSGNARALPLSPSDYIYPRLSPDGTRLAYRQNGHIWLYGLEIGIPVQLTFEGSNSRPVWSPDGERIAFNSDRDGGRSNLYWMAADGSGEVERLTTSDQTQSPSSWSRDGFLAFLELGNIKILPMEGERTPRLFVDSASSERMAAFSRDGKWLAYASTESGRSEVFVRPFPAGERAIRISTDGGHAPLWSWDGRQLFYRTLPTEFRDKDKMMVVSVTTDRFLPAAHPECCLASPTLKQLLPGPTTLLGMAKHS